MSARPFYPKLIFFFTQGREVCSERFVIRNISARFDRTTCACPLGRHKRLRHCSPFAEFSSTGKTTVPHTGTRLAKQKRALLESNPCGHGARLMRWTDLPAPIQTPFTPDRSVASEPGAHQR